MTHYVGIQTDVSAVAEAGLLDRPEQLTEQQAAGGRVLVMWARAWLMLVFVPAVFVPAVSMLLQRAAAFPINAVYVRHTSSCLLQLA